MGEERMAWSVGLSLWELLTFYLFIFTSQMGCSLAAIDPLLSVPRHWESGLSLCWQWTLVDFHSQGWYKVGAQISMVHAPYHE